MIFLVLALNLDLKMSSKLTFIRDSNQSDSPPSVLYGAGVLDSLKELSEESMAPTDIYDIYKTYDCFKSANHILPENPRRLWRSIKKGGRFGLEDPVDEPPTSDATSGHSNLELNDQGIADLLTSMVFVLSSSVTGSRIRGVQQWINTSSSWANTGGPIHTQGNPIGVAPEVPILVTRKDRRLGKLKKNLVVQDENDTDAEGSDDLDGE
ncbi:hypothetical protein O181_054636 [Austropuccinia psidii MF-1]|uniref:Uncharacterized protein n=1 Tax=Austropuccinia psidii MF-1 TaxID=1389203 RepID=A0A9Q3E2X0_9BASI|nr:hypothetical protein [Austropuccinia psidii MF-1]